MKISDKAFGYFSFAVILLIIVGVTFGMWQAHRESSTQAIIDFQELGSLSPEDPMTENGYEIGHVGDIQWLGNRSRVTVVFDEPITLHEGTQFRNAAFALMGQRRIELIRSREGKVLPKDHVFQGEFVPGITESLRFITELHDQVMVTRDAILTILSGNDTLPSVTQKYHEAMETVEGLLDNLEKNTQTTGKKIQDVLAQAENASSAIHKTADAADSTIRVLTEQADSSIAKAQTALQGLSDGIGKIESIVEAAETDTLAQNLLNTKATVDKVNQLISQMEQLIQAINTKGIAVYDENGNKVKLLKWKNLNLIGETAREKAKKRQENQKK
ncbi:MAG: mammalian cell entry protein [Fibrobacter sp.]|nr:mammalian cell entry protein [Fibrobacter sp.]